MAYVISDKCVNCGKCVDVCPVEAISKGEKKHTICLLYTSPSPRD